MAVPSSPGSGIGFDSDNLAAYHTSAQQRYPVGQIAVAGTLTTIADYQYLRPVSERSLDFAYSYPYRSHGLAQGIRVGNHCRYHLAPLVHCSSTSAHLLASPLNRALLTNNRVVADIFLVRPAAALRATAGQILADPSRGLL